MEKKLRRFIYPFVGLVLAVGAAGCSKVNGELHVRDPQGGHWDLVANKCTSLGHLEADQGCQFAIVGADGTRVCVGAYDHLKSGWSVVLDNLKDRSARPVSTGGQLCRMLDIALTTERGYSGHLWLDCGTLSGGHVTSNLTFNACGGSNVDYQE